MWLVNLLLTKMPQRLATVNRVGDGVKRMTTQQIGEAQYIAMQFMERNFKGCDGHRSAIM
jgi:hypothetical protein